MSLIVNQAEAPSHLKVVCFGHGAPKQADNEPRPILLEHSQGFFFVLAFPRALACVSHGFTSVLTVPCHVIIAVLTLIARQCCMIDV